MKPEQTPSRLRAYLAEYGKLYPGLWKALDSFRPQRGKGLPMWRECCYVPIHGAFAYLTAGKQPDSITPQERAYAAQNAGIVTALGTWRVTQGIYRFHPELFPPVWETPLSGQLPAELLFQLPEWCVYVETPGTPFYGFFAHIDDDMNYNRAELRLVLDSGKLTPFVLHLDKPTLDESINAVKEHSIKMMREHALPRAGNPSTGEITNEASPLVSPLVSALLYICSAANDMREASGSLRQPKKPRPKKVKGGLKMFPPNKTIIWETGYRMGAALSRARESTGARESSPHGSPAPHIRRAHWHSFWTGPKNEPDKRLITVKWLPPIPVGVGDLGEVIPTIRIVK